MGPNDPSAQSRHVCAAALRAPVLVVGAPRSGTTLVQRMMLADPRCAGGQESHFLASFGQVLRDFDRKRAMLRPHGLACYHTRAALCEELRGLWDRTFAPVLAARPGATLLVEKTPDHALWLDVAAELFPSARVVHVVRDSRAVVCSLLAAARRPWGAPWAPRSVDAAVGVWRRHVEGGLASPLPVHRVRYEDVVDAEQQELAAVMRFAGLDGAAPDARESPRGYAQGAFFEGGEVGAPPAEPEGFARDAAEARDGWRRELGWWYERRVWNATRDLLEPLGYGRRGRERAR